MKQSDINPNYDNAFHRFKLVFYEEMFNFQV